MSGADDAARSRSSLIAFALRRGAGRPRPSGWWCRCRTTAWRSPRISSARTWCCSAPSSPTPARRALRAAYDLVVTVTGPRETLRTRRKERVAGIWVNVDSREFVRVPSYLAILSNRPVDRIARPDSAAAAADRARQFPAAAAHRPGHRRHRARRPVPCRLRAAGKRSRGFTGNRHNAVTFLTPTVFRAAITLPANVPTGTT